MEAKILITGATGFIGGHLVRELVARGEKVRALCRRGKTPPQPSSGPGRTPPRPSPLPGELLMQGACTTKDENPTPPLPVNGEGASGLPPLTGGLRGVFSGEGERGKGLEELGVEVAYGDLEDLKSLRAAMAGCRQVYHVAALYRLWTSDRDAFYRVNVAGTRNVLEAALDAGVEKVVCTSTHATVGIPPEGQAANETVPFNRWFCANEYLRSKVAAEREALRFCERGLPVVLVNPTGPIGPGDHRPTPTGEFIVRVLNGTLPAYVEGTVNFVHVQDVVAGHLLAMERGRPGARYLLGGENLRVSQMLQLIGQAAGQPVRIPAVPYELALAFAYLCQAWSWLTRRPPLIDAASVRFIHSNPPVDCSLARTELGLPQTPVAEAVRAAVEWYRSNGYVRDPR